MNPPAHRLPQKEEPSDYTYKRAIHRLIANADKICLHLPVILQKRNDGEDFVLVDKV